MEEENVLIQTMEERSRELSYFDGLVNNEDEFTIFFLTTDDEKLIRFYQYLKRNKKMLDYKVSYGEEVPNLGRINNLITTLESNRTIKKYNDDNATKEINEIQTKLAERKASPIKKLINKITGK